MNMDKSVKTTLVQDRLYLFIKTGLYIIQQDEKIILLHVLANLKPKAIDFDN